MTKEEMRYSGHYVIAQIIFLESTDFRLTSHQKNEGIKEYQGIKYRGISII